MSTEKELIKSTKNSFLRDSLETILFVLVILLIFRFVLMSVKVNGTSMEPTYINGERGIMLRAHFYNRPSYHDVVVVRWYNEDTGVHELIVKRVFGLPGDTVHITNNTVFINGHEANDVNRNPNTMMNDYEPWVLGDDEYFVLGDNRNVSYDSRIIGPVHGSDIVAVNGITYWPLNRIGLIN